MVPARNTLVVGIGSSHGDDQVGWRVVEQLQASSQSLPIDFRIAKSPIDLLNWIDGFERLIICDACHGQVEVGTIKYFRWPCPELDQIETSGTHNLSLTAVLDLATKLNKLPATVEFWAIESASFCAGDEPGSSVLAAANILVGHLQKTFAKPHVSEACTNSPS